MYRTSRALRGLHSHLLLTTVLTAALPVIAIAQDAPTVVLDQVTIQADANDGYVARSSRSGTKTDTPPEENPASVSVVGQQQMQDQAVTSVAQALRYTPGVSSEYRGSSNMSDETYIRGFGGAIGGYVPRYLDGLVITGTSQQIDPWLLESVAVVKGPASLLYGQTSPGGLIDMQTKKADGSDVSQVGIVTGTDARAGLRLDMARRMEGTDLSWRVVGLAEKADTQEQGLETRRLTLMPSVRWNPTDATTLTAYAMYQREPDAGYRNFRETLGTLNPTGFGYIPADFLVGDPSFERSERTFHAVGYQLEHRFSEATAFRQNLRLSDGEWYQRTLVWDGVNDDQVTIGRSVTEADSKTEQAGFDNQVEHRLAFGGGEHLLLGGVDVQYTRTDSVSTYGAPVDPINWRDPVYGDVTVTGPAAGISDGLTRSRQIGLYLQDQASFGRLHVQAGLRYDRAKSDLTNRAAGTRTTLKSEALTGRLGLLYEMGNGFSPYVSYSTSFEPVTDIPAANQDAFDPTEGKQLEIGVKWVDASDTMMVTASAYDIRQSNVLRRDVATGLSEQVGEIRSRGFELEAQGRITSRFSMLAGYAYNDSRVSKSNNPAEIGTHNDRVPRHQASVWGKYDFANGWDAALGVRYTGKSWARGNAFTVKGYTLVDAAVGYDLGALDNRYQGLRAQVNVSNLTDEFYAASCASAGACFVGSGRRVTASVDYKW